ncbi:MAG: hypothetical protein J6U93_07660 [Alistipes sp.]|nr:hypothetical protein [Alistipes sp.]
MALDKWEKKHVANIAKYEKEVQQIYATAIAEASQMASRVNFDPSKPFVFSDYPLTKALIAKLQKQVASDIEAVITKGVDTEFGLSQEKAEELAQSVYSDVENALMELRKQAYILQRNKAREAFLTRKEAGLSLSDRVWRYTGQFKEELEMALDLGLRDGLSADELSREVRKYLNNPNMLFRRVRDEHGVLHLSKRAKAYHPGQGVYRSSYKNARRLTATETNMAYRTADYTAYQALSFVVGIRVMLSNNHTLNGEPFFDICDNLSAPNGSTATKGKGCYPKDFKFTGWHPLCRCFVQTIHKTKEELREDTRRMREGLPPLPPEQSANYVGDVPDEFKAWCRLNAGRVERAKSLPYFIRDNQDYYDAAFKKKALTPLELAEQRHAQRTPEHIESVKNRWHERQDRYRRIELAANNVLKVAKDYGEVDYTLLQQYVDAHDLKGMASATRTTAKDVLAMKQAEAKLATFIPDAHKWHKQFTIAELQQVYDAVEKKMTTIKNLPLEQQLKKLKFEAYDFLGGNMKGVQQKYVTWEVSQQAYIKQIGVVEKGIYVKSIQTDIDNIKNYLITHPKQKKLAGLLNDVEIAINDGEDIGVITAKMNIAQKQYNAKLSAELRKHAKRGAITYDIMPDDEIQRLLDEYNMVSVDDMDKHLRSITRNTWAKLTLEERRVLTKYTQTYSYLNEPLRGLTYSGNRPKTEYNNDLPILTSALNKFRTKEDMVVRRGTRSYYIPELNKDLSMVQPGDMFTDGAFLSTAAHREKGFFLDYNMIIVVPKGARGAFAEPFSHYTDSLKFDWGTDVLWDGKSKETIRGEFEWIGQRGCRFKVLKVEGRNIYMQLIGQLT